ncbi:MAG: hypothetical protein RL619_1225 [Bacteroidota bacterium]
MVLNASNQSLLDLFRGKILGVLLVFIFSCYLAFKIIGRGINKYIAQVQLNSKTQYDAMKKLNMNQFNSRNRLRQPKNRE